jgi:hypothetical protein
MIINRQVRDLYVSTRRRHPATSSASSLPPGAARVRADDIR